MFVSLCVLLLLLVLISQWVRQTAQASTNTTLMLSIHYPPSVTVYTENNDIRIGYQSFSAALFICFNLVTCLVRQFFHLPLHKIHLSQTSVNVKPCINCFAWIFLGRECNPLVQSFSIPVLAPPLCIFCMSLFVNTPDSDNQLVRSALHAWTVFWLTCSLHSVHCSLHRVHCSLHRVHCSLHRVHCSLHRVHCSLHRVHCSLHRVHCSLHRVHCSLLPEQGNPLKFTLFRKTFIHGFALRNVFTHGWVWHHIPL